MSEINTHNKKIDFGKHEGERWTRLPVHYLRWLANNTDGESKEMAEAELDRRDIKIPDGVELSNHAINRASQITKEWQDEGVVTWLQKRAEDAWHSIETKGYTSVSRQGDNYEVEMDGYRFSFVDGNYYPTLKTIVKK